jgi:hypothetical protein
MSACSNGIQCRRLSMNRRTFALGTSLPTSAVVLAIRQSKSLPFRTAQRRSNKFTHWRGATKALTPFKNFTTLIDALRIPMANERYTERKPDANETPFFVLLEENKFVTKLSVETDQLLEFDSKLLVNQVMLIINARVRPSKMHMGNLEFGG